MCIAMLHAVAFKMQAKRKEGIVVRRFQAAEEQWQNWTLLWRLFYHLYMDVLKFRHLLGYGELWF